jgi:hypothetical protein
MPLLKAHMTITGTPDLGADGKAYRANFVHAPFPEKSALRPPPADKGSGVVSQNRLQVAMRCNRKRPMMNANPQTAAEQAALGTVT